MLWSTVTHGYGHGSMYGYGHGSMYGYGHAMMDGSCLDGSCLEWYCLDGSIRDLVNPGSENSEDS